MVFVWTCRSEREASVPDPREAASHARWDAEAKGGTIEVYDSHGQLFKTIEIEEKESVEVHSLLPSA